MEHRALLVGSLLVAALFASVLASGSASAALTTGSVAIVFPLENSVVSTAGTRVRLELTDFTLDPNNTPCLAASNNGRVRLYVDDVFMKETSDANTSLDFIPMGSTKIGAELICTDGTSFDPQVWHNITVTTGEPEIDLLEPGNPVFFSTLGGRVDYRVRNFTFAPGSYGGPKVPGEGHVHLFVDGSLVGTSVQEFADVTAFPEGPFTLKVELHNNDHSLVTTAAHPDGINVTASAMGVAPAISIVSPSGAGTVSSRGFRVSVRVAGIELDAEHYGGSNIPGHGHIHYFVDSTFIPSPLPDLDVGPLSPGIHTVRAELVNNDHSSLVPAVSDQTDFTVADPSIAILTPANRTSVGTGGFRVQIQVEGHDLSLPNYGGDTVPGQGHIHYFVDGALVSATTATYHDVTNLEPGEHTIRAELVNNDHSFLNPRVFAQINVTASGPSISILSPANRTQASTLGGRISVRVQGFVLDQANYGGANVAGQGHIHYYLDNTTLLAATTSTYFDVPSLPAGRHTLRAELRNNDHSALSPAVLQWVLVDVVAPSITIVEPKSATVATLGFRMVVSVAGLELDQESYAGPNIPGRGHIHYLVDSALVGAVASAVFDFGPLTAGVHTIRAELRNNDHSALNPAVFETMSVTAGPPEIRILEPLAASTVSTLGFRMRFEVANFTIDPKNYAGTPIPGQGHIHVLSGGSLLATPTADHVLITGLGAGLVTLRAELRNNDHSALSPAVFADVVVTVTAPSITLDPPAPVEQGDYVTLTWTVTGFVLDAAAFGGPPEPGRGHVHIFVDGTYVVATPDTSFALDDLAVGTHTISVVLYNNDHTELSAIVSSEASARVDAPAAAGPTPAPLDATGFYSLTGILVVIIIALTVLYARKGRGRPPGGSDLQRESEAQAEETSDEL